MTQLKAAGKHKVQLPPGAYNNLIRAIEEEFCSRFVPGGQLIYAGSTGSKFKKSYLDSVHSASPGATIENQGKMPDVVIYCKKRNWLVLVEAATSHGPIDAKRLDELKLLFANSRTELVFVSAFPDRKSFAKYRGAIAWETVVWIADCPTHLIHFDGSRLLGSYVNTQ